LSFISAEKEVKSGRERETEKTSDFSVKKFWNL